MHQYFQPASASTLIYFYNSRNPGEPFEIARVFSAEPMARARAAETIEGMCVCQGDAIEFHAQFACSRRADARTSPRWFAGATRALKSLGAVCVFGELKVFEES